MSNFYNHPDIILEARTEIDTNLFAPIALSKLFLPILERNANPQIVNITTGLIYAPKTNYPFYNATKAALHSFTQVLRNQLQLQSSPIEVKEVMLPAVDTPWHKGTPPKIAIPVDKAVDKLLKGIEKNKEEIRIGGAMLIYIMSRIAPKFAISKINSLTNK